MLSKVLFLDLGFLYKAGYVSIPCQSNGGPTKNKKNNIYSCDDDLLVTCFHGDVSVMKVYSVEKETKKCIFYRN